MSKLILMRHGESQWNKDNLFTGWVDVPLSKKGIDEALKGGEEIKDIPIDLIFTSTLIRANLTLVLALLNHCSGKTPVFLHKLSQDKLSWDKCYNEETWKKCIPVISAWELNERMYGQLQGFNKTETAQKYGKDQVQLWRRSYAVNPPEGESLKMTAERAIPYFQNKILPPIKEGQNVFISAHGNSLRSIVMYLEQLSEEEVLKLEIATGQPLVYDYLNSHFLRAAK